MGTKITKYKIDAVVDLKWYGLFREIKKPHLSITIEDVNTDEIYVGANLTEDLITAMLTENTILTSQGLNPRYAMKVGCELDDDIILDQILGVFDYIGQPVKSITYTF